MEEGKSIWIESLLTDIEYTQMSKKYPATYKSGKKPAMFECDFKWRYGMGSNLTAAEINLINTRIDLLNKISKMAHDSD